VRRLADVDALREAYDLVVVGAGPAGMAAAAEASGHGRTVLVLDENPRPGGQIYRAIGAAPLRDPKVLGAAYWEGRALAEAFAAAAEVDYLPGATVWHLDDAREVGVSAGRSAVFPARRVILATGALERPMPVRGWTLPGVMTVGAGQTLLKAQGIAPTGRVALAGCGPLLWLYAAQCVAAGAAPSLILETTPRANWRGALRHLPAFLTTPYARKGLALMARVRRHVRVVSGVEALSIAAEGEALRVTWAEGAAFAADHVLLHQGVVPNLNLARAAGCAIAWDEGNACFAPVTDAWGTTSLPGIAVAGDGAGIAGAEAAALRGRLAALEALCALGALDEAGRDARAAPHRAALARWSRGRAFLDALYRPAPHFRAAPPDAIACRCEEATGAAVREAVRMGATGPNQLKAFLRCGMGPCQGRLCGPTVTETIAQERGVHPSEVGYFRLRTPVKPITLGEFAALRKTEADLKAVERR
jgi:NADPH-dependent 2,4-dienoyl-CoA reductase/sulfur reductase-like enzyme